MINAIDRLHAWAVAQPTLRVLTQLVRVLLALAFVPSGLVKILGEPFTTLPTSDPVGFFFAGFFSARGYYRFIGVIQWTAAALLLLPRTATLGAILYLPIIVNIFAITVAIGPSFAGTRLITGAMLLANVCLLCWDWDRWKRILPFDGASAVPRRYGSATTTVALLGAAGAGLAGVTRAHLARLHHESYRNALLLVVSAGAAGLALLVIAYRQARAAR